MQTVMQKAEVGKNTGRCFRKFGTALLLLLGVVFGLPTAAHSQVTFTVGSEGTYKDIQTAVEACPSTGCIISLTDTVYKLPREIWIQQKNNLTIQASAALQAQGIRPRLYYGGTTNIFMLKGTSHNPDDAKRPAGWRKYPTDGNMAKETLNDSIGLNIYTSGFQQNGYIVVMRSKNVTLNGLKIDGNVVKKFINKKVWSYQYDVYFGNVGVNIFQSYQTTVKNCEIINCFAGMYMNGRNIGGALALKNPDDLDVTVPMSRFGQMGDNVIEGNYIHHNWWGIYNESEWDLSSSIRYNIFRYDYNTSYTINKDSSDENNNQAGGMMYMKDAMLVPHKIYNNTIDNCALIMGHGYFKAGRQVYFYNNLVTNWYKGSDANLRKMLSDERQLLSKYTDFVYNNTFAADSFRTQGMSSGQVSDAAACAAAGQANSSSCWLNFDKSVNVYTGVGSNLWIWNDWAVKQGGTFTGTYKGKSYTISNNQAIDFYNVGGPIVTMGTGTRTLSVESRLNNWMKDGVPFLDTNSEHSSSAKFMMPDSTDRIVDSTLFHSGWEATGRRLSDGSMPWRGAKPAGTEVLELKDQSKVVIDDKTKKVEFSYSLSAANTASWSDLKWDMVKYYKSCPRSNGVADAYPTPSKLTPDAAPSFGSGTFSATLPTVPADSFARIDLIVSGTYAGKTVKSNVGSWLFRRSDYDLKVIFLDPTSGDTVKSVRVGDKVKMVLIVTNQGTPVTGTVDSIIGSSNKNMFLENGTQIATAAFDKNVVLDGNTSYVVYWTQTGSVKVNFAGMLGSKVISGSGNITVRPGLPYKAVWQAPPTYSAFDHSISLDSVAYAVPIGASQVALQVVDSLGNNVDTVSTVDVSTAYIDPAIISLELGGSVSGPWTSTTYTVTADSTGAASPWLKIGTGSTEGQKFWGFANVTGKSVLDSGLMKVGKPLDKYFFSPNDAIDTFITIKVPVHIILSQDGATVTTSGTYASDSAILGSTSGELKFYSKANPDSAITSVTLKDGEADFLVTSPTAVKADQITAYNAALNGGMPSYYQDVTFTEPPVPQYPVVSSARFIDGNCNGQADSIYIDLKSAGVGGVDTLDPSAARIHEIDVLDNEGNWVKFDSTQYGYVGGDKKKIGLVMANDVAASPTGKVSIQYSLIRAPLADTLIVGDTFTVTDGVAPQVDSAVMYENDTGATDVFLVRLTESMNYSGSSWPFITKGVNGTVRSTSGITVDSLSKTDDAGYVYRIVVHGNRSSSDYSKPTIIQYTDSLKLDPSATFTDAAGNAGTECSPYVKMSMKMVLPAFKGTIGTSDSIGRANELRLTFTRALTAQEVLDSAKIRFGSREQVVPFTSSSWEKVDTSTYAIHVPNSLIFDYGTTRGLASDDYGARVELFGTNSSSGAAYDQTGYVKDSVPVVLVNFLNHAKTPAYAKLLFGTAADGNDVDTLKILLSEPSILISGAATVRNRTTGEDVGTLNVVEVDSTNWSIVQNPQDANHVSTNDWITLGNRFRGAYDGLVATQGTTASKAIVKGGDRPPTYARYSDPKGLGTASQLTMYFPTHLTKAAIFTIVWGGVTVYDTIDSVSAVSYSGDTLTRDLSNLGLPLGVTGPADGGKAWMRSTSSEDTLFPLEDVAFNVEDHVPPVVNSAHMSYGSYADELTSQDTLLVTFSEKVVLGSSPESGSLLIKRQGTSKLENVVGQKMELISDTSAYIFFDTSSSLTVPVSRDSVRLIAAGAVTDTLSNQVGSESRYVIVTAGRRPAITPTIKIILPGAASTEYLLTPDANTASTLQTSYGNNVAIITHQYGTTSGAAKGLSTTKTANYEDLTNTIGVDIPANEGTLMEHSVLSGYIYDKYGTFVGKATADLYPAQFTDVEDATGKFSIQILWDGRAANGALVARGVYAMRILLIQDVKLEDGSIEQRVKWNYVKNIGIKRPF